MASGRERRFTSSPFWGSMARLDAPARVVVFAFVLVAIAAMSFCQLAFWPFATIDDKPVYLMLVLGPLVMGSFIFGPLAGAVLGLFSGAVLFAHALLIPLDFYEVYFMTPLNTFVLLSVFGAVAGWLMSLVWRSAPLRPVRFGLIALACVALSFAASGFMMLNTLLSYGDVSSFETIGAYLFNSPLGVAAQALIDAALMTLLCWAADVAVSRAVARGGDRALLSVFRNWMLLVSAVVFMVASAVIFSVTTLQAQDSAAEKAASEIGYLQRQAALWDGRDFDALLDGYDSSIDGWVVLSDEGGTVLATIDEERFAIGSSLMKDLGYDETDEPPTAFFASIIEADGGSVLIQGVGENGGMTMDAFLLTVGRFDAGYVAIVYAPAMIYASRLETMAASTFLAVLLIAAIAILATVLLNRVVVRRIDETNSSLGKITDGNLDERVRVDDSREFISLSTGINTTVSALRDTIEEVEQRNAQDLATAKTIQESALPREFPPFPHIGDFDIYASMKTAKEVGGDFYDFFLIGDDEEKLGFVMADVSGKGIPAALFMMSAKTQIRNYMDAGLPLGEAVNAVNHQLCIGNDAGMFVTAWIGVLDYKTGALSYVNAGHNPPLLLRGRSWEWIRDVSGMPLGLFDGIPYDVHARQLEPADMLYLYTDGVTEAMDADGSLFGEERLEKTLCKYAEMNPRSVGVGVRRAITDFTLDCEQSDDITMLILKFGVLPEKKAVMILDADSKQLVHVFNFIHEELKRRRAPKAVYNPLDIAAEELFVNVCHYAYPDASPDNPGEVRIGFEYEANPPSLTVTIADDGIPYDPLAKPDAVTPDNIADVPIGGLGILMAKRSVDDMAYERVGGSNVVTFVKKW